MTFSQVQIKALQAEMIQVAHLRVWNRLCKTRDQLSRMSASCLLIDANCDIPTASSEHLAASAELRASLGESGTARMQMWSGAVTVLMQFKESSSVICGPCEMTSNFTKFNTKAIEL